MKPVQASLKIKVAKLCFKSPVIEIGPQKKRVKLLAPHPMSVNVCLVERNRVSCVLPREGKGGIQFLMSVPQGEGTVQVGGVRRYNLKPVPLWSCALTIIR